MGRVEYYALSGKRAKALLAKMTLKEKTMKRT
jgi:hypothetical protein